MVSVIGIIVAPLASLASAIGVAKVGFAGLVVVLKLLSPVILPAVAAVTSFAAGLAVVYVLASDVVWR